MKEREEDAVVFERTGWIGVTGGAFLLLMVDSDSPKRFRLIVTDGKICEVKEHGLGESCAQRASIVMLFEVTKQKKNVRRAADVFLAYLSAFMGWYQ